MPPSTATVPEGLARRASLDPSPLPEPAEALDAADVADLAALDIARMTPTELVRVILASDLPVLYPEVRPRLEYNDRETLQRLAFLARAYCRNRST